jgi:protein TonB
MDLELTEVSFKYRPPKPPPYPAMARRARIQGLVVVQVMVGADGVPISAVALEGPVQLRAAAMADAMTWRINPPTLSGIPQVSRIKITYNFQLGQ